MIYSTTWHSSLHTLKQSGFYPWLTCPPRNFHRGVRLLQKQSLTTPPRGCQVHGPARAMRHWEPAAMQWTEFDRNPESSASPGESCARLPAGLQPHQRLWCPCESTWSDPKGTVWIKGWQSVAAPLASHFWKSDHLQLSISHFWLFTVAKCCQRNSRDHGH